MESQIQLLPTPAVDAPPELTHRIRVVVAAGRSHPRGRAHHPARPYFSAPTIPRPRTLLKILFTGEATVSALIPADNYVFCVEPFYANRIPRPD
jgi:hypothetical protein